MEIIYLDTEIAEWLVLLRSVVSVPHLHCYHERQRRLGDKARLLPFTGTIFLLDQNVLLAKNLTVFF